MIRALWFALRIGLIVALAVWLADQPGAVEIAWQNYVFTIDLGFFLLALTCTVLLAIFLYTVIKTFVDFPKSLGRYNEIRRKDKGYEALTIGLAAVAAGDTKTAAHQAKKATKYLPEDKGLPVLLSAQAARLEGREEDAVKSFTLLLEDKNASFLGVRGLLQRALDNEDPQSALRLAQKALELHPRQKWILKIVYDLHIRLRHWKEALKLLDAVSKYNALSAEQTRSDRTALHMVIASNESAAGFEKDARDSWAKALKINPAFAPAASALAKSYAGEGYKRKAKAVIESCWKKAPHPDLVGPWMGLMKRDDSHDALARLRWLEALGPGNAASPEGFMALAEASIEAKLWGEARAFLEKIISAERDVRFYRLLARIEADNGRADASLEFEDKAKSAMPAPNWHCEKTGRVYPVWTAVTPHGAFNTIQWGRSMDELPVLVLQPQDRAHMAGSLIEAPASKV